MKKGIFAYNFQALSVFRIYYSAYLFVHFCFHDVNFFNEFYTDNGILPITVLENEPLAGLRFISPALRGLESAGPHAVFPVLFPVAVIAFGIGYWTRLSNAIVFALQSYLFWRNPYVRNGAEYLSHLLLLWCLFLPMDRYWSVDAALDPQPRDRAFPVLPFLAMRLQISSLYVFAGMIKLASPEWIDGVAVIWSLKDNVFGAQPASLFLVKNFPVLLYATDYFVIAFQLIFPLLIYCPWHNSLIRAAALIVAALTHLGFILCLSIGGFPYLCLIMLVLLIPDVWIERALCVR